MIWPKVKDVLLAASFLNGKVRHTPVEMSLDLSEVTGGNVYLKWENLQFCGSFKIRGALNKIFHMSEEERKRGVVTASSGNHAQGVAVAAKMLNVKAVIFVPGVCPATKQKAIKRLGGDAVDLRVVGHLYDDAELAAMDLANKEGLTYVSPYEDHYIVSGAGTVGLEMLLDEPDLDMIVVPAGGGGLITGIAIAAKALSPGIKIIGVQSVASMPWVVSWQSGRVVNVCYSETLADGLTGTIPQSLLDLARTCVDDFIAVTEEEIAKAIAFLHQKHHQVVEGAGAVGVAALLSGRISALGRNVGVVISGGNIDHDVLLNVLLNNQS
ncbi:MAG TPA: threonine/serine dehydratase [Acetomicrobium sp.]|jgi:threonine dehydratase|uniref:threonine ammonia-lyase n=1 Tax=Acetomicrobium mobile TaxID=97477 RepID=UPI0016A01BC5|nr:threonine/serine dehydratase [Acetomicrobium mobile]NLI43474.1 pyridoxal-phosphate dependent enzyme [Synergistaceae bacterium]HQA37067.1 threonine/serine dehydratase [Acetomicrobium sp.]